MNLVFVYGSLLSGFGNHDLLHMYGDSPFVGEDLTEAAFTLVNLGAFPGLIDGGTTAIMGEVYRVGDNTLRLLDQLEGHPNFYRRTLITLQSGVTAHVYMLPRQYAEERQVVKSGNWRKWAHGERL